MGIPVMLECDGVGVNLVALTVPNDPDFFEILAVFWSLVPYSIMAVFIISLCKYLL